MTEYEKLCETTLLNQEALVRELRYQAAVAGPHGDDIRRALKHHEAELDKIRSTVMHTIIDPEVARQIIHDQVS